MATILRPRRAPQPPRVEPLPADVRLMHSTANALFMLAGLLLVCLAAMGLMRHSAFELRGIRIEGEVARNSEATIRANAAPKLSGNFFTMDLQDGQRAFESVPWVRHAVLRRIWPDRLAVALEEHRPAAVWAPLGTDANAADTLVNSHGEVFVANLGDVADEALPTLSGPPGQSALMLGVLHRLAPLFARMDRQVDTLEMTGRGSWRVDLDDGAHIELGRGSPEELLARTERFVGTVAQLRDRYQRPVEYADLRHHEGYALRLKGVSTTLTAAEKAPGK
jgi:cell division protein FtsQ